MRIVFAGSGEFGVPALGALVDGGQDVALIVTQPARPAGRGRLVRSSPIRRFARERGIPCLQPEDINAAAAVRRIRGVQPDLLLVIAFAQKIADKLLNLPPYGGVNLHASLLPKYRGAAPINWAIINSETETGLTVIQMVGRMDAGDILGQRATPIDSNETAADLYDRLARLGARLVTEVVRDLALGEVEPRHQNETQATFARRLKKTDGRIDWNRSARGVHNHIRGVTPWPGAYTHLPLRSGKTPLRLVIERSRLPDAGPTQAKPGVVVQADSGGIDVATAKGAVRILAVTPAGKRTMTAADFLNGYPVRPGTRLLGADKKVGAGS